MRETIRSLHFAPMALEVEHKFLVHRKQLPRLPAGERIEQGYLSLDPMVRVRVTSRGRKSSASMTIKGKGLRVRAEYEYAIPVADARKLLQLCGRRIIEKVRRRIGPIELDEFLGRLKGFWMAELELKSERARLPKLPPWIGKDVTEDARYTNVRLALQKRPPFTS